MLTARAPFRGTADEVMYQHQHAPLPINQLPGIPEPVVALLEKLLEKDPAQIEASFGAAIRIAREQKSISLVTRALESYEAYRSGMRPGNSEHNG